MKAARLVAPKKFDIFDTPTPTLKPGEVLVKTQTLSICGSDMLTYDHAQPEENYPLRIGAPCHECSGIIEESTVDNIKPGQRVVALNYGGSLMEYIAMPAERVIPVPETSMDPSLWVLCQPAGTVIYGVRQLGNLYGKRVLVLGQGPIGLTFTNLIAKQGASQIITTDIHDYRLDLSKQIGATHTINARNTDVVEAVTEITNGELADVVIEAVGLPETCNQVFKSLRLSGTAMIFGMQHGGPVFEFDWGSMYRKVPNIFVTNSASAGTTADSVRLAVDMVAHGNLDLGHLVTHRVPFNELGTAYEMFANRSNNAIKVLINV